MAFNNRQLRLIVLTAIALILVFALARSSGSASNSVSTGHFSNHLLDTNNDDKMEEAINNDIKLSKQTKQEEVDDTKLTEEDTEEVVADDDGDFDPVKALIEIRSLAPMVIFSKTFCPYSKRLKKLLKDNYEITPEYSVVELDKHKHGKLLQDHLAKVSGRGTVPNVLIGTSNDSKGGCDDFLNLHESGKLVTLLNEWGDKKLSVKRIETPSNM